MTKLNSQTKMTKSHAEKWLARFTHKLVKTGTYNLVNKYFQVDR